MTTIYGSPNARGDNVVVVCHALTGNSRVAEWWPEIAGPGALFDPRDWCIVGVDFPCHPEHLPCHPEHLSCHPEHLSCHPELVEGAVRDAVSAQRQAIDELGFERIRFVIGGSLGGMQALQWALDAPDRVDHAIVIGAHDHHSAMGIALNAVQREAIAVDPVRGLGLARKIAMLTYKSEALFNRRHERRRDRNDPSRFDVEGYLDLQARRFTGRIDAATYVARTHAMDGFDVRERASQARAEVTFVGISSDWLFRPHDVRAAAERFGASYLELESDHGHDAFLAEANRLRTLLEPICYSMTVA